MNILLKHSIRFVLIAFLQALVLNQLEIGFGIHVMVYPLFILLLPFETSITVVLFVAFAMGMVIDSISNTYGLHTSALLMVAYFRPIIFKMFAPREGYDPLKESNFHEMGTRWYTYVFGILLLIHHFWFFLMEIFRFDQALFVLQKTLLSLPFSFLASLIIQMLFIRKPKER